MPFSNPIVGGEALARNAIRSPDYVPGISGWAIFRDGSAEFNDALFRGSGVFGTLGGVRTEITTSGQINIYNAMDQLVAQLDGNGLDIIEPSSESYISLLLSSPRTELRLQPPKPFDGTYSPGRFYADHQPQGGGDPGDIWCVVESPQINTGRIARILAYGENVALGLGTEINVQADRLSLNGRALGGYTVARAFSAASSAAIAGETTVLTTNSATFLNGHAYRWEAGPMFNHSLANGRGTVRVRMQAGQIVSQRPFQGAAAVTQSMPDTRAGYFYNTTGADIASTVRLTLDALASGGTMSQLASATDPRYLLVTYAGVAADYDFGVALV